MEGQSVLKMQSLSEVDVKEMPAGKISTLKNSVLKNIAMSVNKNKFQGTEHQNHNSGGGGGGEHTRS